jgi:hypothetical protein
VRRSLHGRALRSVARRIDPNGRPKGLSGPVGYWHVDDLAATVEALVAAGGTAHQAVTDVGGGKLVATVTDADGNEIGLIQPAAADRSSVLFMAERDGGALGRSRRCPD